MRIYLDNAATTAIDPGVVEKMQPYLTHFYGNPSSIHTAGREARTAVENARKSIARIFKCSPSEIFFTSGATEADNMALMGAVHSLGIETIITSPIEHHAVLHTAEWIAQKGWAKLHFVSLDAKGRVDVSSLETLLKNSKNSLVSLMHGNNEIGNLTSIHEVSMLCRKYGALFHSDTVQTLGYIPMDLQKLDIDFIVGSAHKFHGPKGVGFIYINGKNKIEPFIHGGAQERNMRGGTENVAGIVGLAKAIELAQASQMETVQKVLGLKNYLIQLLAEQLEGVTFNGDCLSENESLPHVVSISTPKHEVNEMLLFNLDIEKISVSGGSACTSGAIAGSHVLAALGIEEERGVIRFSLSKYNTMEEIEIVVRKLKELFGKR